MQIAGRKSRAHDENKSHLYKETEAEKLLKQKEGDIANGKPVAVRFGRVELKELLDDLETEYKTNKRRSFKDLQRA